MERQGNRGPLRDVLIVDMSHYQQGPVATRMLADMGAEVIKVERRLSGDPGRNIGAIGDNGLPSYFENTSRNKKSITLDFRKEKGRKILYELVKNADVFVENFRSHTAEKHGFSYEDLCRVNPSIIYSKISGWGLKGPSADLPAFDAAGQAIGGIASMVGEEKSPLLTLKVSVGDQTGAFLAAFGILLALFHRERTGRGQRVDTSLLGGQVELMGWHMQQYLLTGVMPPRSRHRVTFGSGPALNCHLRGKEGKWFVFQVVGKSAWERCFRVLGMEELLRDPRFDTPEKIDADQTAFFEPIEKLILTRSRKHWLEMLRANNIVCAPINNLSEAANDPDVIANEYVTEIDHPTAGRITVPGISVKLSDSPGKVGIAPNLGEHTKEILQKLGYSSEEIEDLKKDAVI